MTGPGVPDERLAAAVGEANIPTLLAVLVQLTGELGWLEEPYRPRRQRGFGENDSGGLADEVQNAIRSAARAAILAWRQGRPIALPNPRPELLVRMLSVMMGEEIPAEYGDMIAEQVGLEGGVVRPAPVRVPESFEVLVIGAGVAGICAAQRLLEAGIPFRIVEKASGIGGTWRENRYPGAGVDVPNHLYGFSFAPGDWSMYFALREEIHRYLSDVADRLDLERYVQFGTEVRSLDYREDAQRWAVTVEGPCGATEVLHPNVVISAVGIFNPPKYPDIEGLDEFRGDVVHTAVWPDGLDLTGKRVALIGSGASAMQVGPEIRERVAELVVFQRSPQWAAPFEQFRRELPAGVRLLLREVPLYRGWYRARVAWMFNDRIHPTLQKDPDWTDPDRSLNAHNAAQRKIFEKYIESELGDRTDLLDKVVPDYPLFGKRMLLDNGWYRMLRDPKVSLVTDGAARLGVDRVVSGAGEEFEVDAVVLATGFDVQRYLSGFETRGRGGALLREVWGDTDPKAYLAGLTVPDFPNLFVLYGPNSQPGHGGSVVALLEMLMNYVTDAIRTMVQGGIGALECRRDVFDEYVSKIDEAHDRMIWTHPRVSSYYRNEKGRVVVIYPFRNVDLFHETRRFDLSRYIAEPQATGNPEPQARVADGLGGGTASS
ncbi:flavin-containing monooxygenase [Cryptosporangium sp. NPDC051539]|uniref:flavin-containing monooxygenase n=1 Tax=Cryptosporangium sp. NPDC051539 TaxID=3363962 RepID=UPI00378B4321